MWLLSKELHHIQNRRPLSINAEQTTDMSDSDQRFVTTHKSQYNGDTKTGNPTFYFLSRHRIQSYTGPDCIERHGYKQAVALSMDCCYQPSINKQIELVKWIDHHRNVIYVCRLTLWFESHVINNSFTNYQDGIFWLSIRCRMQVLLAISLSSFFLHFIAWE